MKIKQYDSKMEKEVRKLIISAFTASEHGYNDEAQLTDDLRNGREKTFEIVAIDDGELAGHALLSEASIENTKGLVLAPISVLPNHQRSGVGTKLMQNIDDIALENKYEFISILGDPKYYERFGYFEADKVGVKSPMKVESKYFMIKLFNDVIQLNGTLKYADAFGI